MTSTLSAALAYVERGWSVFPVQITNENGRWKKKPIARFLWEKWQTERPSKEQVVQWWEQYPDAAIAVVLGQISNIIRIDAEGPIPWDRFGPIPETAEFTTISGGKGYLLKYMDGVTTEQLWKGNEDHQELRIQSNKAYTIVPPFQGYEWVREEPVASVPEWLRNHYVEQALAQLTRELRPTLREPNKEEIVEALQHIPADDYDMWIQVGMALKTAGEEYFAVWDHWASKDPSYLRNKPEEMQNKWRGFHGGADGITTRSIFYWAQQNGWSPPNMHEPLTDRGNANMLARLAEGKIGHSSEWGWLAWDNRRWTRGGDAVKIVQEIQKHVIEIRRAAAKKSLRKHAMTDAKASDYLMKLKSKGNVIRIVDSLDFVHHYRGARELATSCKNISVDHRTLDQHHFLFNCDNGTVNLKTGEIREHEKADKLTTLCQVKYNPDANCPMWSTFLEGILPDPEVRAFIQRFLGYCLTGDVSAQIMPVFWGSGANGKSTLVETVFHVLGDDYAMKAKRDLLIASKQVSHPTSIARMAGKRFIACVETDEMGRFDEPLLKELTGDDVIAARRMKEDEWQFRPTHKLILATNHKPEVKGTDDGIWRRIPLIPFTQQFLPEDPRRIPDLKDKLKDEASGILNWMIEGCRLWVSEGKRFLLPGAIKAATDEYRTEQDKIGLFLQECCDISPEFEVHTGKLMEAYVLWCHANKQFQLNGTKFGKAMTEKGFNHKRDKYRGGIRLKS